MKAKAFAKTQVLNLGREKITLERNKIVGTYNAVDKLIVIDSDLKGFEFLQALLHEGFHHFRLCDSDAVIDKIAHNTAKLLWEAGYRLRKKGKSV